jgi:hypothetical protein
MAYRIRLVITYNNSTELTSPPISIAGPGVSDVVWHIEHFFKDLPPNVKNELPSVLQALDEPGMVQGLALFNMIRKLKKVTKKD